uniref:PET117 cytochrome c oxidase chaperone n=1 Tax=Parastrongyloides trichosuri TaxID=131310 RepID=A0A0N4ZX53_PARTI
MVNNPPINKMYGKKVFIGTCIFSAVTIAFVLWDERNQRERRQGSVKYRLLNVKQKENMAEYEMQKQKYQEYKAEHS